MAFAFPEGDYSRVIKLLEVHIIAELSALAFGMQRAGRRQRVDERQALSLITRDDARSVIEAGLRLNLLREHANPGGAGVEIAFAHQWLQAYFAALALAQQPNPELNRSAWRADAIVPNVADILQMLPKDERLPELPPTGWEETTLLAAEMSQDPERFVRDLQDANLPLAGRCAALPGVQLSATTRDALRWALVHRSRDPQADLRARIAAGLALGPLGDPRFKELQGAHGRCLLPPMIKVPADTHRLGDNTSGYSDENEIDVTLPAFEIGQFPVTNAEYRCFIEAGGYDDERWWETSAAKAWRNGTGSAMGRRDGWRQYPSKVPTFNHAEFQKWIDNRQGDLAALEFWRELPVMSEEELAEFTSNNFLDAVQMKQPGEWQDVAFNAAMQPVVGVCWHEARAYCAWLSAAGENCYRLPHEHEWEAAVRVGKGVHQRKKPGVQGGFSAQHANIQATRVERTTPVGVFPAGDAANGLVDAVGNVYEWTLSMHIARSATDLQTTTLDSGGMRVVRGGAWNSGPGAARAAFRVRIDPDGRSNHFGFRVVCAPSLLVMDDVALSSDLAYPDLSSSTAPRNEAVAVAPSSDPEDPDLWGALPS